MEKLYLKLRIKNQEGKEMTVEQLINHLKKYPKNSKVFIWDSIFGFDQEELIVSDGHDCKYGWSELADLEVIHGSVVILGKELK